MKLVVSLFVFVWASLFVSASYCQVTAPLALSVMAPEGYPDFQRNPSFIRLKNLFAALDIELALVERKGARESDRFEHEVTDIIIERGDSKRMAALPDFVKIPAPVMTMQTYVYTLARNKDLDAAAFCMGPWSIGWRMRGVEELIADHFGCDQSAPVIWQNSLQGRARMLQADRFLLLTTLSFFESVVFVEAPDAVRLEPPITTYNAFLYINKKYQRFIPLLTEKLKHLNAVNTSR